MLLVTGVIESQWKELPALHIVDGTDHLRRQAGIVAMSQHPAQYCQLGLKWLTSY